MLESYAGRVATGRPEYEEDSAIVGSGNPISRRLLGYRNRPIFRKAGGVDCLATGLFSKGHVHHVAISQRRRHKAYGNWAHRGAEELRRELGLDTAV